MSAGLPGLGLGGLFFMASALLMPAFELIRTLRGASSRARWGVVARNFTLALVMVGAVAGTYPLLRLGLSLALSGHPHLTGGLSSTAGSRIVAIPLVSVAGTATVLAVVLLVGKAASMVQRLTVGLELGPRR